MDVSAISNNSYDIQSLLINSASNGITRKNSGNDIPNRTANYAQKGEPMYMAEMDADGDGTVTLDEFKDYCKDKGINSRDMLKMSKMASAYRTMKAENETIDYISKLIPNIHTNVKQANSANEKNNENKYNISDDKNNDYKVSYNEYMDFCKQNTVTHELKTNTKVEETNNGELKITNSEKAFESYGKANSHTLKSTFEDVV